MPDSRTRIRVLFQVTANGDSVTSSYRRTRLPPRGPARRRPRAGCRAGTGTCSASSTRRRRRFPRASRSRSSSTRRGPGSSSSRSSAGRGGVGRADRRAAAAARRMSRSASRPRRGLRPGARRRRPRGVGRRALAQARTADRVRRRSGREPRRADVGVERERAQIGTTDAPPSTGIAAAVHEPGVVGREEDRDLGDVLGLSHAPEGVGARELPARPVGVGEEELGRRGADHPGQDRVRPDPMRSRPTRRGGT